MLETLPSTIGNLSRLKELNLRRSQVNDLPEEVADLPAIELLNVDWTPIAQDEGQGQIPPRVAKMIEERRKDKW